MVTPETLLSTLKATQPGDVLDCEGSFPRMTLPRVSQVTLRGGTWAGIRCDGAKGLSVLDAEFRGDGTGEGLKLINGEDIRVEGCLFSDFDRGVSLGGCDRVIVTGNSARRMMIDGFDFGRCHDVSVTRNSILGGLAVMGGAHPDGIQFWSRATDRPSSGIVVRDNLIVGPNQGVFLGNHVRFYPAGTKLWDGSVLKLATELDDGGFDDVEIAGNRIVVGRINAIAVGWTRGLRLTRNHVSTLEGAEKQARIYLGRVEGVTRSGNVVDGFGRYAAASD